MKKYTISQKRFLNWYIQDNTDKIALADLIVQALNKQGICRISIKKLFDSLKCTISSYNLPDYDIDQPEIELIPNENLFLEPWKD